MDRVIVGVTGASGAPLAIRTIEALAEHAEVVTVVSDGAKAVMAHETGGREETLKRIEDASAEMYGEDEIYAPVASGSVDADGMVVVPCSMNTLAAVASGLSGNLITRAADVTLKEGRKLVVVPRETPLNQAHLENMLKLSKRGVDVVPPMLGFYFDPETREDFLDHVVGKILERFGVEHDLYDSWDPKS